MMLKNSINLFEFMFQLAQEDISVERETYQKSRYMLNIILLKNHL